MQPFFTVNNYLCSGMKNEKDIQRVTSQFMQDLYEVQDGGRWAGDDLLLIRHVGERSSQVFGSGEPFKIARLHIGIVVSGEQDVTVNLRRHHLSEGSVLIASPESIMQENGRTQDFDMQVVHVSDSLLRKVFGDCKSLQEVEQTLALFAHRMSDLSLRLDGPTLALLMSMLDALWQSVHFSKEFAIPDFEACRNHLLAAILNLLASLSQRDEQRESRQPRNVAVFNHFLSLVAEYCDRQRTLDFYAGRLCLSKQYLGSLIMEVSHRSAREWIDEAALQRIKMMLRHSNTLLNDISERMTFAEPSHFSRYFKRLTGMTPNEYRCKK